MGNADDAALPGFRLRIPLLAVLDALKSDNPAFRRAGETWMRSSLKSYVRCGLYISYTQQYHLSIWSQRVGSNNLRPRDLTRCTDAFLSGVSRTFCQRLPVCTTI